MQLFWQRTAPSGQWQSPLSGSVQIEPLGQQTVPQAMVGAGHACPPLEALPAVALPAGALSAGVPPDTVAFAEVALPAVALPSGALPLVDDPIGVALQEPKSLDVGPVK